MNCSLFAKGTCLVVLLFTSTTILARWELTDFDRKFTFITARNGMLVGIEEKTNMPFKWEKPLWKKLSDQEFIHLATDGTSIVGVKQRDNKAYIFERSFLWKKLGTQLNISFEQLVFGQQRLFGRGQDPYGYIFAWDNSSWSSIGAQKFWGLDATGTILCGVQQSYESKALNHRACIWQKKDWQKLGTKQFKQLITNGTRIIGLGQHPQAYAFEWAGNQWRQLGTEKLTQLAFNKNLLCGIQEKIQLILVWNGQKWLAYDTKKFVQVVTDGSIIYGLANNKKVYYWTNK